MATRRTSGRARPAKRYTNDAFEGLDLGDEAEASDLFAQDEDSGDDDDFDVAGAEDEPDVEDDISVGAASGDDDDGDVDEMLSDDDIIGPEDDRPAPKKKGKGKPLKPGFVQRAEASTFKTGSFSLLSSRAHAHQEPEIRLSSRGVPEMYHNTGKDTRILNLFGPAKEDVIPATTARDKWHDEPVLPSRKANKHGEGGMTFSPAYTKSLREHEATKGWEWYHERGGEQAFKMRQETHELSASDAAHYLPQTGKSEQTVLLGPARNQNPVELLAGEFINIGQAWSKDAHRSNDEDGLLDGVKGPPLRQAWLFSLGSKIQCLDFLTCDENYTLLALSLRRFHVNMSVGRANSNIQHISASPVHPFTLIGCTDGMVISTNPMRKVLIAKAEMWHQTWFMHEWRRAIDKNGIVDEASAAADTRSDLKKPPETVVKARPKRELKHAGPIARIVDGFKAEVYKLWVEQGLPNQYEGVVYNTIYEEETASTQVAWNPNLRCGGWAAAGMGDGLIRIEDLAL
ncbi:hypothetical protein GTA08_BOTSDO06053 [Neofusicoccum parvum]|nr:hypothetical protein GTA08_BOTSDO06053 [Neofusicoccum parvum]